jgi:hypothetical protein
VSLFTHYFALEIEALYQGMKRTIFSKCPNPDCSNHKGAKTPRWYWRRGTFITIYNNQPVPRYQCKICKRSFSSHTFRDTYQQKKPFLNAVIAGMLTESSTVRGTARALKTTPTTVLAKLEFLGKKAKQICQEKWKEESCKTSYVQFDELETSQRSQCLPLTIAFAVRPKDGSIITAHVGTVTCRNNLADVSRKRFGERNNQREKVVRAMLKDIKKVVRTESNFTIASDRYLEYKKWVDEELPFATYDPHSGSDLKHREKAMAQVDENALLEDYSKQPQPEKYWIKAQKNGKRVVKAFDPLFHINQKCAVLRSRMSRLRRRFWGFTQEIKYLEHHLWLFIAVNNGYEIS